jgi:hypothetical protein
MADLQKLPVVTFVGIGDRAQPFTTLTMRRGTTGCTSRAGQLEDDAPLHAELRPRWEHESNN